jgi:hypothetical protein
MRKSYFTACARDSTMLGEIASGWHGCSAKELLCLKANINHLRIGFPGAMDNPHALG